MIKEDIFIASLEEIMPFSYHMLCVWHIIKNIIAQTTKYFSDLEQLKN